jgi:hypothetical protein
MKELILALALTGLVAGPALAQQSAAPGQRMQASGSVKGTTGASGYAPGQEMHKYGSVKGTKGASGYAPGHVKKTIGMSHTKSTVGMSRGDRDDLSIRSNTSTSARTTTGTTGSTMGSRTNTGATGTK